MFESHVREHGVLDVGAIVGKNLACWCKRGEPCHADVLLRIANTANE